MCMHASVLVLMSVCVCVCMCALMCVVCVCGVCIICSLAWYAVVHLEIKARITELVEKHVPGPHRLT